MPTNNEPAQARAHTDAGRFAPRLLTLKEAANVLGVCRNTVRNRVRDRSLAAKRLGSGPRGQLRIEASELERFIEAVPSIN